MFKLLVISQDRDTIQGVIQELASRRLICHYATPGENVDEEIANSAPDLVIVDGQNVAATSQVIQMIHEMRDERPIPILALIPRELMENRDIISAVEDFAVKPCGAGEVIVRLEKILKDTFTVDSGDLIRCGELMIDLSRREVTLDGKPLALTFKEYELLQFMAANRGRVFTREGLLNKIWGYDYYGGDRTVDVHIRRLRAKIEGGKYSFIETVRGVGYKFSERY